MIGRTWWAGVRGWALERFEVFDEVDGLAALECGEAPLVLDVEFTRLDAEFVEGEFPPESGGEGVEEREDADAGDGAEDHDVPRGEEFHGWGIGVGGVRLKAVGASLGGVLGGGGRGGSILAA